MFTPTRITRSRRATVLACALLCAAAAALASAAPSRAATALPPQGVYDDCSPATQLDTCEARLTQLGQAGFKVVLNYDVWDASWADLRAYADAAQANGIQIIWPFNNRAWRTGQELASWYPRLSHDCGCDDMLTAVMAAVRDMPVTWGYYVGDEVDPSQQGEVADLAGRVRALDPAKPLLYVANGNTAVLGGNLAPFAGSADVVASDIYVVGTSGPLSLVQDTQNVVQQVAARAGKRTAAVLQAFNWGQYPSESPTDTPHFPTRDEMLRERNYALAGGDPSIILWYSLKDIANSDDPAGHFADLAAAAMAPLPDDGSGQAQVANLRRPVAGRSVAPRAAHHRRAHRARRAKRKHEKQVRRARRGARARVGAGARRVGAQSRHR